MSAEHAETSGSMNQIEADIAASRTRLARTIDELTYRTSPKVVAKRSLDDAKARFDAATRTPDGDLRVEAIGALVAAAVALLGLGTWRRTRS